MYKKCRGSPPIHFACIIDDASSMRDLEGPDPKITCSLCMQSDGMQSDESEGLIVFTCSLVHFACKVMACKVMACKVMRVKENHNK